MTDAQPNAFVQFIPLVLLFVIFYFLMIRPQQKKQKEHTAMLGNLQKNDEVITSGGIHGTLVSINEQTVSLRIADNVKIEIDKNSVTQRKGKP